MRSASSKTSASVFLRSGLLGFTWSSARKPPAEAQAMYVQRCKLQPFILGTQRNTVHIGAQWMQVLHRSPRHRVFVSGLRPRLHHVDQTPGVANRNLGSSSKVGKRRVPPKCEHIYIYIYICKRVWRCRHPNRRRTVGSGKRGCGTS